VGRVQGKGGMLLENKSGVVCNLALITKHMMRMDRIILPDYWMFTAA
jgi:hypothetical protein